MHRESYVIAQLMHIIQRHLLFVYEAMGKQPQLHPAQLPMMVYLHDHQALTQAQLSRQLNIKPSTVAISLRRLERAGMVERQRDASDGRLWRVHMSEQGRRMIKQAHEIFARENEVLLDGFSEQERETLNGYLKRMTQNIRSQTETQTCERCTPWEN